MPSTSFLPSTFSASAGLRLSRSYSAPGGLQTITRHVHLDEAEVPASHTNGRLRRASSIIPGAGRRLKQVRRFRAFSLPPSSQNPAQKKSSRRHSLLGLGLGLPVHHKEPLPPCKRAGTSHGTWNWLHHKEHTMGLGLALVFPAQLMISCHEHGDVPANAAALHGSDAVRHGTSAFDTHSNNNSSGTFSDVLLTPPGAPLLPSAPFPPYARSRSMS